MNENRLDDGPGAVGDGPWPGIGHDGRASSLCLRWLRGVLCGLLACAGGNAVAGDLAAGRAKAEMVCRTCHGLDGRGTQAMVANIGGQQKEYLIKQLRDFRAGRRQHAQMSIIANMLSEDDIENLAAWYASIVASFAIPESTGPGVPSDAAYQ